MDAMTGMVERVARAIYDIANGAYFSGAMPEWDSATKENVAEGILVARAAIEAMLEPTIWMDEAPMRGRIDAGGSFTAAEVWKVMIHAALNDDKAKP